MKRKINYYGTRDNYIHLKFGDCRKAYHFTKKFVKEHLDFAKRYQHYFENGWGGRGTGQFDDFRSPFEVVAYAFKKSIPVHFYYNFTDTPATDYNEIIAYLVKENTFVK
jgi:hypothetical protein